MRRIVKTLLSRLLSAWLMRAILQQYGTSTATALSSLKAPEMAGEYPVIDWGARFPGGHRTSEMVIHRSGLTFRMKCECGYMSAPSRVSRFTTAAQQIKVIRAEYMAHIAVLEWARTMEPAS